MATVKHINIHNSNYNSAVGTFCNNIANDLPITVNDPSVELEMLFVDDLITEMR